MTHELTQTPPTEGELKKHCIQLGEHLYVKPGQELELEPIVDREKRDVQIVFLMGGGGTRLLHITKDRFSKHMIRVNGQPLSRYTYDLWRNQGFDRFCFLIDDSHRGKSISDYYGDGKKFGAQIEYSVEHGKLGSGGAMRQAIVDGKIRSSFVNHQPDDVIVGYENFPSDFFSVFKAAEKQGYQIVTLCVPGTLYSYGEVYDEGGKVKDFIEKPFIRKDTNTGITGISREAFHMIEEIEEGKEVKIERTVYKTVARSGRMFKVLIPCEYWIPVNDDLTLKKLRESIRKV
ncbi:MAG: NDP-sugar synthase [Candidatus Geothermarchaeales archaeon]